MLQHKSQVCARMPLKAAQHFTLHKAERLPCVAPVWGAEHLPALPAQSACTHFALGCLLLLAGREVTALLQRKSSWVPADVARFTQLYAAEHETEQAVAAAKARYSQLSDEAELLQLKLVDLIRERYQQVTSWVGGCVGTMSSDVYQHSGYPTRAHRHGSCLGRELCGGSHGGHGAAG